MKSPERHKLTGNQKSRFGGLFMKSHLLGTLLILAACQAQAVTIDQIVKLCESDDAISWLTCSTYVNGVFETQRDLTAQGVLSADHLHGTFGICPPDDIANGDIRAIAVAYLKKMSSEHPLSMHQSPALPIAVALQAAYPCGE
jgi:hypothetical protein